MNGGTTVIDGLVRLAFSLANGMVLAFILVTIFFGLSDSEELEKSRKRFRDILFQIATMAFLSLIAWKQIFR